MKYEKHCQECKAGDEKLEVPKSLDFECPKCIEKSQDEMPSEVCRTLIQHLSKTVAIR